MDEQRNEELWEVQPLRGDKRGPSKCDDLGWGDEKRVTINLARNRERETDSPNPRRWTRWEKKGPTAGGTIALERRHHLLKEDFSMRKDH